jgi:transcriptional regulator with XRE-family HTH domain
MARSSTKLRPDRPLSDSDDPMDFEEYLRTKRDKISYRDLSKLTGISHAYLRNLEQGLRPWKSLSLEILEGLATGLGVPADELIRIARGKQPKNTPESQPEEVLIRHIGIISAAKRSLIEAGQSGFITVMSYGGESKPRRCIGSYVEGNRD